MHCTHSDQSTTGASDRVVRALADHLDTDPSSLETPLYDEIDPDALDALFQAEPVPTVRFHYREMWVVVRPDRHVVVADERPEVPVP